MDTPCGFLFMQMRELDCDLTLMESAQVFHWQKLDDGFAAVVNGRVMTERDTDAEACAYFDDDRDYTILAGECGGFASAGKALEMLPGLKVLNQPAWEALIAFILSANNNVKRIRSLVMKLCETYGDSYSFGSHRLYGFPTSKTLAKLDPNELKTQVTCGYRAEYLVETAKMITDGFELDSLREMSLETARRELMKLKGVGPKVADCVLLFGCGHADAFPVDVWVARLMESWFGVTGSREHVCAEARRLLGEHCGLIQQALFHAARTGKMEL